MTDDQQLSSAQREFDNREELSEECVHRWIWLGELDGEKFVRCGKCHKKEEK